MYKQHNGLMNLRQLCPFSNSICLQSNNGRKLLCPVAAPTKTTEVIKRKELGTSVLYLSFKTYRIVSELPLVVTWIRGQTSRFGP
jgi:hypothetical protein